MHVSESNVIFVSFPPNSHQTTAFGMSSAPQPGSQKLQGPPPTITQVSISTPALRLHPSSAAGAGRGMRHDGSIANKNHTADRVSWFCPALPWASQQFLDSFAFLCLRPWACCSTQHGTTQPFQAPPAYHPTRTPCQWALCCRLRQSFGKRHSQA